MTSSALHSSNSSKCYSVLCANAACFECSSCHVAAYCSAACVNADVFHTEHCPLLSSSTSSTNVPHGRNSILIETKKWYILADNRTELIAHMRLFFTNLLRTFYRERVTIDRRHTAARMVSEPFTDMFRNLTILADVEEFDDKGINDAAELKERLTCREQLMKVERWINPAYDRAKAHMLELLTDEQWDAEDASQLRVSNTSSSSQTSTKSCTRCQTSPSLKRCSACHAAYYCSKQCQRDDWKAHKPHCRSGK
jgi:MYND finger